MPDPASLAITSAGAVIWEFGKELLGGVSGNEAHRFYLRLLDSLTHSPIDDETGLPKNHHLVGASRDALKSAALVLCAELAETIEPQKPWLPRIFDHIREGKLGKIPLIEAGSDPKRSWVKGLLKAIESDCFDSWLSKCTETLMGSSQLLDPAFTTSSEQMVASSFIEWARRNIQDGDEPPDFETFATAGWPGVKPTDTLVTLWTAYRLFFRENLKARPEVFRIYLAEALDDLGDRLKTLPNLDTFEQWLAPKIALISESFLGVQAMLGRLETSIQNQTRDRGAIHAGIAILSKEVAKGNSAIISIIVSGFSRMSSRFDQFEATVQEGLERIRLAGPAETSRMVRPFCPPPGALGGTFVGRESELTELTAALKRGAREWSVWGMAGMGKTALVAEAIRSVVGESPADLKKAHSVGAFSISTCTQLGTISVSIGYCVRYTPPSLAPTRSQTSRQQFTKP